MAVGYNPSMSSNGLTYCFDPGNTKSYPGSGSTLIDSLGKTSITLVNSPTYTTNYLKYTTAQSGYSSTINIPITTTISVSAWVRIYAHGDYNRIFGTYDWNSLIGGWLLYDDATNWNFGIAQGGTTQYTGKNPHNNSLAWTHLVGTYDGSIVKIYVNGVLGSTTASVSGATLESSGILGIGAWSGGEIGTRDISQVAVYNRGLTSSEVLKNFNALRGRFGI